MQQPIIEGENISKSYRLGQIGATKLKDEMQRFWARIRNRTHHDHSGTGLQHASNDLFWALEDVSFSLNEGDVLGIVGKNGAGKSTILKIMSRITEPTSGTIKLRGRVASLLEVGTGFHPDLTGRENVFLNGAILGMTKREVQEKYDEIIAFSEIEQFIDTPVKRYSSGMFVRLAFAVAAHLDPEILIIDEVLSVGDASFQKKCLGKMNDLSGNQGRTVLFVSHNMNAVENICDHCLYLESGRVKGFGSDVGGLIRSYLQETTVNTLSVEWVNNGGEWENDRFMPERFYLSDESGRPLDLPVRNDSSIWVSVEGTVLKPGPGIQVGYGLFHVSGPMLYWSTNRDLPESQWQELASGKCVLRSRIPVRFLNEGEYRLDLFLGLYHRQWFCEPGVNSPSIRLEIKGGLSDSPYWVEGRPGIIAPVTAWNLQQ